MPANVYWKGGEVFRGLCMCFWSRCQNQHKLLTHVNDVPLEFHYTVMLRWLLMIDLTINISIYKIYNRTICY